MELSGKWTGHNENLIDYEEELSESICRISFARSECWNVKIVE
jgi:hypothetical protein